MTTPDLVPPSLEWQAADLALRATYGTLNGTQSQNQAKMRTWMGFFLAWLGGSPTVSGSGRLVITLQVISAKGAVTYTDTSTGGPMATAMTMDDTITVTAAEEDDHGDPVTSDTLSLTSSDAGQVLTWTQNGNQWTGVPAAEGSATATVSDPANSALTGTVDITVGPGAASQIAVSAVVNTGANVTPPPA